MGQSLPAERTDTVCGRRDAHSTIIMCTVRITIVTMFCERKTFAKEPNQQKFLNCYKIVMSHKYRYNLCVCSFIFAKPLAQVCICLMLGNIVKYSNL